jgi:hypothetical protein
MRTLSMFVLSAVALLVGSGSALAESPVETVMLDPIVFTDVNPCTEETHTVTLWLTLRAHEFELTDPGHHHGTTMLSGTISTSDGFFGRITEVAVDNGAGLFSGEEGRGMETAVTNAIVRSDSGDAFSVHTVFHVTVVGGAPILIVDRFQLECID